MGLVPGQVVLLDRLEFFDDYKLKMLLRAYSGRWGLVPTAGLDQRPALDGTALDLIECVETWEGQRSGASGERALPPPVLVIDRSGISVHQVAARLANAMGSAIGWLEASMLRRPVDLLAPLCDLQEGDVMFIGNIDELDIELHQVLRDSAITGSFGMKVGNGSDARTIQLALPRFVLVASTSRPERLDLGLRNMFGLSVHVPDDDALVEKTVKDVWTNRAIPFASNTPEAVAIHPQRSRRFAFHAAHRLADLMVEGEGPTDPQATGELAATLADLWKDYTESDWLLMDFARGVARTVIRGAIGGASVVPPVVVVGTTQVPWESRRDLRKAFGEWGDVFRARVVLPAVVSTNTATLRFELANLPLIR